MYAMNRRAVWMVAVCALVVSLATVAPARATTTTCAPAPGTCKPYSVVLTDDVAASGSTVTGTITNENTTQQLGSADLTGPVSPSNQPLYTFSSASVSQVPGTTPRTATVDGNIIHLRDLALMPGQSLTVTITLTSSTCTASTWSVVAKQSNDFSGVPGNNLTLDVANSNLNTGVCGTPCPKNTACNTNGNNSNGAANVVAAKSNNAGQLFESVNPSKRLLVPLTCENPVGSSSTDYMSADQNTYGVFATADRAKVVTITIPNVPPPIDLSQQQVCFEAPYQFGTANGAPLQQESNGDFVGLLQSCSKTSVGPCHNRTADSVSGSTVTLVVDIPSGLPGDPHMN